MDHLPPELAHALHSSGRSRRKGPVVEVRAEGVRYPVLRVWDGGFAVAVQDAPRLRGFVDLLRGGDLIARCLIVLAEEEEAGVVRYEYKRRTSSSEGPPVDYEIADDAPVALLT